jgi:hypothetical protein
MKFVMEIELRNSAFAPSAYDELTRILQVAQQHLEQERSHMPIHDVNGNAVGAYWIENWIEE